MGLSHPLEEYYNKTIEYYKGNHSTDISLYGAMVSNN